MVALKEFDNSIHAKDYTLMDKYGIKVNDRELAEELQITKGTISLTKKRTRGYHKIFLLKLGLVKLRELRELEKNN